jgi:hypothetical protein
MWRVQERQGGRALAASGGRLVIVIDVAGLVPRMPPPGCSHQLDGVTSAEIWRQNKNTACGSALLDVLQRRHGFIQRLLVNMCLVLLLLLLLLQSYRGCCHTGSSAASAAATPVAPDAAATRAAATAASAAAVGGTAHTHTPLTRHLWQHVQLQASDDEDQCTQSCHHPRNRSTRVHTS